jgi:methylase of polypeptide subunit release factors
MPFGELTLVFDDEVLRPREWTMAQSLWAAELAARSPEGSLLELCSGVGQIGLLTVVRERRDLVMVDANPRACELARRNVDRAGLTGRVDIRNRRLHEALDPEERFVGVIADPPWVPRADVERYPEDPRSAIDGGPQGLDVAWSCVRVAAEHLVDGGWLLIQLGNRGQAEVLAERSAGEGLGFRQVEIREYERGVLSLLERRG